MYNIKIIKDRALQNLIQLTSLRSCLYYLNIYKYNFY